MPCTFNSPMKPAPMSNTRSPGVMSYSYRAMTMQATGSVRYSAGSAGRLLYLTALAASRFIRDDHLPQTT